MNATTMEDVRSDLDKRPEQLEREADTARSAVEGTLAALEQRLSPGEMIDRLMDLAKRHGGGFGDNLLAQVKNNPLPTIMASVGFAWLMAASKRPPPTDKAEMDTPDRHGAGGAIDGASATSSLRDTLTSTVEGAKHIADEAIGATTSIAKRAANTGSRSVNEIADSSRATMRSVTETYDYLCREQPFVLGAVAVAAGAALGAILPSTPMENSLLGSTSDRAKSRLKDQVEERTVGLRDSAVSAVETVKRAVGGSDEGAPNSGQSDSDSGSTRSNGSPS
jgi:hypothetical protein